MIFKKALINRKAVSVLLAGAAFLFFSCQPISKKKSIHIEDSPGGKYSKAVKEYREGSYENAVKSLGAFLSDNPGHPEAGMLKYYLISSLYHTGKYQDAITGAVEWLQKYPENPEIYMVQKIIGLSNREQGKYFEAFFWMLKAYESSLVQNVSKTEQDDLSNTVKEIINDSNAEDLDRMVKLADSEPYLQDIYYRLAGLYLKSGNLSDARHYAGLLLDSTNDINWKSKGGLLLDDIIKSIELRGDVKRSAVGCLLPLKGSYSLYGKELLKGIELGTEIFRSGDGAEPIDLIIKNTNGSEEDTVSAIDDLVDNEKVIAMIGPLASATSAAAGKSAQKRGVPIITFTQRQGITEEGDMVFRNFLTPSKEVEVILKKAVNDMGMTRFGIFYPDTSYGRFFMNLFWDRVEEMGCEITAVESYNPKDTDFTSGIKKMVGLHYPRPESVVKMLEEEKLKEERAELEKFGLEDIIISPEQEALIELIDPMCTVDLVPDETILAQFMTVSAVDEDLPGEEAEEDPEPGVPEEEKPEPIDDFDAVFIPDNSENIALIAPQFPFNDIYNIPYLGTSLWMSNELIETTAEYIQGAVFPSGFYVNRDSPEVSEFVKLYHEVFEEDPGILAANGYDTIKLVRHILGNIEVITRADFQKALAENDDFIGVTGKISFDGNGEVEKDPVLLTVYGKSLHTLQLNPPPPEEPESSLEGEDSTETGLPVNVLDVNPVTGSEIN